MKWVFFDKMRGILRWEIHYIWNVIVELVVI